jgi:virginiamycin B lyase
MQKNEPTEEWGPIVEYPEFPTIGCYPCEAEFDLMGNVWTAQVNGNKMAKINPKTLEITEVPLPNKSASPGALERGPDGNIWFAQVHGNAIGRLDPVSLEITNFELPWGALYNVGYEGRGSHTFGTATLFDMTFGNDGNLYFIMAGENAVGRLKMVDHTWEKWDLPTPKTGLFAMQRGPGDTVAFSAWNSNEIGLFDVFTEEMRLWTVPTPKALVGGLTRSPDGKYLWFTEGLGQKIGRLDPVTGEIEEWELNGGPTLDPGTLRFGSDGMLYFVTGMYRNGDKIGRFDTVTKTDSYLTTPTPNSAPCDLNADEAGRVYFGEFSGNRLAYFDIPKTPQG